MTCISHKFCEFILQQDMKSYYEKNENSLEFAFRISSNTRLKLWKMWDAFYYKLFPIVFIPTTEEWEYTFVVISFAYIYLNNMTYWVA